MFVFVHHLFYSYHNFILYMNKPSLTVQTIIQIFFRQKSFHSELSIINIMVRIYSTDLQLEKVSLYITERNTAWNTSTNIFTLENPTFLSNSLENWHYITNAVSPVVILSSVVIFGVGRGCEDVGVNRSYFLLVVGISVRGHDVWLFAQHKVRKHIFHDSFSLIRSHFEIVLQCNIQNEWILSKNVDEILLEMYITPQKGSDLF